MNKDILSFIKRLHIDGCKIQVGWTTDVVVDMTEKNCEEYLPKLQSDNCYYVSGVHPEKAERAGGKDIIKKNCFTLDFDVLAKGKEPRSIAEIKEFSSVITDAFKGHPILDNWSAVIFTGGGLHITYFGNPVEIESPEHYKAAMKEIHLQVQELLPEDIAVMLDPACIDIPRLFRLPGTKNHKRNPVRDVEILEYRDGVSFDFPKVYAEGKKKFEEQKEAVKEIKKSQKDAKELFAEGGAITFHDGINALIPIQEIVCSLFGWESDGRNFWEPGTSKKKACFVPEEENFLVHGGTDHLPSDKKGYSVFQLVKVVKKLNNKETFEWFEEHYPDIKEQCTATDTSSPLPKESKAKKALALALKQKITLFSDQFKDAFVRLPIDGHYEIHRCTSRGSAMREWLSHLYWTNENNTLSGEDKASAIEILSAMAKYNDKQFELHNRVAYDPKENAIWYDLSDERCRAVRIRESGWSIYEEIPIIFNREQHQKPQVEPSQSGGDVLKLLDYIRIEKEEHQLLYLMCVISFFIPHIPHPVASFSGRPGSAKSTATKITKAVVDPSRMEAFTLPTDEAQLVQQLSHHWCAAYDNINYLNAMQSDCLCRAITGGGHSKRVNYSDDDDKIYNFRRCILLNGVNQACTRSDLVDRSLIFSLERILGEERKTERELNKNFEKDLPIILGGIFDVLVKAIKIHPTVKLTTFPRMADFAEWGCAIAISLGYTQEEFENALESNRNDQNDAVLSEDWLAPVIQKFMKEKTDWEGTATELVALLDGYGLSGKRSPKPNTLSRHLQLVSVNLEDVGIYVSKGYRGKERIIRLGKTPLVSSEPTGKTLFDDTVDTDDDSKSSEDDVLPDEPVKY